MDWDLGVLTESANKTGGCFNQLLDNLRSVHEEVCARVALLEVQVTQNGNRGQFVEIRKDDTWLPTNFTAPEDGPPPARPPPRQLPHGGVPKVFDVQAASILGRQQEHLSRSIEDLTGQQEYLSEQITKLLTMGPAMGPGHKNRTRNAKSQSASACAAVLDAVEETTRASRESGEIQQETSEIIKRVTQMRERAGEVSQRTSEIIQASSQIRGKSVRYAGTGNNGDAGEQSEFDGGRRGQARFNTRSRFAVKTGYTDDFDHVDTEGSTGINFGPARIKNCRTIVQDMLDSTVFAIVSSLSVFAYAGLIAIETNMISEDPSMNSLEIKILHYLFTGLFCLELMLRVIADGMGAFFGPDAFWNRLDAVLITGGLTEIVTENAAGSTTKAGSVVRAVRIGRIIRTVRLIRTFHQFHDFQKMAYALVSSFKTLVCSLALLVFVMFFFAVYLTQSAANDEMQETIQDLGLRYGSLMSTTYTLFLSVSGGISWDVCYMPLHHLSLLASGGFMVYIIIVLFGLLNVVTSVFVESVIRSVQHYKDIIVSDKEEERKIAVGHVREVFRQVDQDGSGQVSVNEMEYFLADPALRRYMDALDIESADTRLLFRLLDLDGSGIVDVEEFCEGCLRLKGSAKSIDIHALIFRIRSFCDKWAEFTDYVEESFAHIRRKLPGGGPPPPQKPKRLVSQAQ